MEQPFSGLLLLLAHVSERSRHRIPSFDSLLRKDLAMGTDNGSELFTVGRAFLTWRTEFRHSPALASRAALYTTVNTFMGMEYFVGFRLDLNYV